VLTVTVLAVSAVFLLSSAAAAQDIGDKHSPDPLSALSAWLIYGGTVGGGFLIATILSLASSRGRTPRYRPGRPWPYPVVWFGPQPHDSGARPKVALPGAGGARGRW
jgi:hypothetical protein